MCGKPAGLRRGGDKVKRKSKAAIVYIVVPAILGVMAIAIARNASALSSTGGVYPVAIAPGTDLLAGDSRSDYNSKCAKCHDRDGRAKSLHARHEKARDLTSGEWQDSVSDERIYNSISNGKGKMPAFKKKLSDAQMDELVNYVRRLRR